MMRRKKKSKEWKPKGVALKRAIRGDLFGRIQREMLYMIGTKTAIEKDCFSSEYVNGFVDGSVEKRNRVLPEGYTFEDFVEDLMSDVRRMIVIQKFCSNMTSDKEDAFYELMPIFEQKWEVG